MGKIKHHHLVTAGAEALALVISVVATAPAYASETASATIALASSQVVSGQTQYTYDLSLTNTSTDGSTVGTFWFAWIPHQSYLATKPNYRFRPYRLGGRTGLATSRRCPWGKRSVNRMAGDRLRKLSVNEQYT